VKKESKMVNRALESGVLFALFIGLLMGGLAPVAAQGTPVSPPSPVCDGPARTAEEVATLKGRGPEQIIARVERTGLANEADVQAIGETAAGWFACLQAQDTGRVAAFLSDNLIARDLFALTFDPGTEELPAAEFLGIFAAWNLSDGRIVAVVGVDDSSQTLPVSSLVMVFVTIEGRWLIDDVGL
jgi:ketosteroid isomerase-like protein